VTRRRSVRVGAILVAMALVLLVASGLVTTTMLVAACLIVVVPAVSFSQLAFLERVRPARIDLYRSSAFSIALMGGVAFADGYVHLGVGEMGLGGFRPGFHLVWGVVLCVVCVAGIWAFNLVGERYFDVREPEFVRNLLPQTGGEKAAFFVLSIFAGVGEEIAFRGFLLTAVAVWTGSVVIALVVSSIAFALVHAYQGTFGMVRTGGLGMLLGASLLMTGSLVPAIVAHTLIDWVLGLWLGRRLLGPVPTTSDGAALIDPGRDLV
jgi:membrane protease YdiL (CAAX protease family)